MDSPSPLPTTSGPTTAEPELDAGLLGRARRGEIRGLLEAAIDELPLGFRAVFVLRALEEMSVEETVKSGLPTQQRLVKPPDGHHHLL